MAPASFWSPTDAAKSMRPVRANAATFRTIGRWQGVPAGWPSPKKKAGFSSRWSRHALHGACGLGFVHHGRMLPFCIQGNQLVRGEFSRLAVGF